MLRIFFSIIILFSATNLYADPMKVENDWDIIESTYVDKLSNVDNTFTLEVIDNVLQAKSINSDEYCPVISFDYLDEILKQYEDDTTYRVFLFDDNSLHLYKYNYHAFTIILKKNEREKFLRYLKKNKIIAFISFEALHLSEYGKKLYDKKTYLGTTNQIVKKIVRLPMHNRLKIQEVDFISKKIKDYFSN